ncbi:hypothetical protein B0F90DRAFT_1817090 [Multifurca ochricompacta]|uniref:Uncharacterized protein n=1 Tax=Multifurca ochricompacta TaxID=376703 RepID=A0AAD4QNX1_9AGAM|nr:hypothetical protein B0F90DRAFT_1817090 [Multifurca ochricompacta]
MTTTIPLSSRRLPPSSYRPTSQSKRNSDSFPWSKLPIDPFSNSIFHQRDPVVLSSERLYHTASTSQPRRDVILVIGVPGPKDLAPLLNSERLAFSLLIIASHQPPTIPPKVQPAVRILHLTEPLGLEQAGAIRFVNTLEWAERVARVWRRVGGIGVRELAECDQECFGVLTPPLKVLHRLSNSNPPSVSSTSSTSQLDSTTSFVPTISSMGKLRFLNKRTHRSGQALPSPDPSQRPFDALINYLPADISDKSLLKQAILVTTISRPFLVAPTPPSPVASTRSPDSRRSSMFKRMSFYSMPPTPPLGSRDSLNSLVTGTPFSQGPLIKPHLVHLLHPRPRNSVANRVLHSIEAFLLSFSFPPSSEIKITDGLEPARTCLLESASFAEPIATPPNLNINWTVADVLLSGCLDDESSPHAWLSGAADIIVAAPPPLPQSPPATPPAVPLDSRVSYTPSSNDATLPSHLSISALPTPPESEEDASYRHASPKNRMQGNRSLRWKFWRRPSNIASATLKRV